MRPPALSLSRRTAAAVVAVLAAAGCDSVPTLKVEVQNLSAGSSSLGAIVWSSPDGTGQSWTASSTLTRFDLDPSQSTPYSFTFGLGLPSRDDTYRIAVASFAPLPTMPNLLCVQSSTSLTEAAGFSPLSQVTAVLPKALRLSSTTSVQGCYDPAVGLKGPLVSDVQFTDDRLPGDSSASGQQALAVRGWNFTPTVMATLGGNGLRSVSANAGDLISVNLGGNDLALFRNGEMLTLTNQDGQGLSFTLKYP